MEIKIKNTMKYIKQWFGRLIFLFLAIPTIMIDICLFLISLGIFNLSNLFFTEKLRKLWK